ncbi:MAG: aldo/keto reductase [Geitlerinemataceae cyanobacterium]
MISSFLQRLTRRREPLPAPPSAPLPEMEYVTLGRTGLRVSVAGLGSGGHSQLGLKTGKGRDSAIAIVRQAIDWGVNLLDTAEAYGSESVIGQAIRETPRDRLVLSTKKQPLDDRGRVITPQTLKRSLWRSLKALNTSYVDIYHLHGVKPQHYDRVVESLMPTLLQLRDWGDIRAIGVTESFTKDPSHAMLARALEDDGWDVVMAGFNCLNQTARREVFPKAATAGAGVMGMFAVRNALRNPQKLAAAVEVLQRDGAIAPDVTSEQVLALLDRADVRSLTDLAYRYCRHQPGIDTVMFGTGCFDHLHQNIASLLRPALPEEVVAYLDRAFAAVDAFTGN